MDMLDISLLFKKNHVSESILSSTSIHSFSTPTGAIISQLTWNPQFAPGYDFFLHGNIKATQMVNNA